MNKTAGVLEEKCAMLQATLHGLLPEPGDYAIGIDGLTLYRREQKNCPQGKGYASPHATVVFQGAESVSINGREFVCGQCQCRMTSKDAFGTGHIAEASAERPFLAASLKLDPGLLRKFTRITPSDFGAAFADLKAVSVETAGAEVLDAFFRLVLLHRKPAHIPVLAPLIIYEIHYLLVAGTGSAVVAL